MARHGRLCQTNHRCGDRGQPILRFCARWLSLLLLCSTGLAQSPESRQADTAGHGPDNGRLQRPGDPQLRIRGAGQTPFVEADTDWSFSISGHALVGQANQSCDLVYSLHRVADGAVLLKRSLPVVIADDGSFAEIEVEQRTPSEAGVYEVRCQLAYESDKLWSRIRRQDSSLASVGRPIMVLPNPSTSAEHDASQWHTIGQIRPSERSGWSVKHWLPTTPTALIPGNKADSVVQLEAVTHAGEPVSLIKPGSEYQTPLPTLAPGAPHKITLRYPAGQSMQMQVGVSTTGQPDDSHHAFVLVETQALGETDSWRSHTFVHYPESGDQQLRLVNLDPSLPMLLESISVHAGPRSLHQSGSGSADQDHRLAVLRLDHFDWIDALTHGIDERGSRSSFASETIAMHRRFVATQRLQDYAGAAGFNAIMIPAMSSGQTWYPSEVIDISHLQRPADPHPLETCMRLIDRGDLQVIVGLDASAPLTRVVRAIRRDPPTARELIRGIHDRDASDQYNPLHPLVQDCLVDLVRECDQQLRSYACYAGLALACDGDSHAAPMGSLASIDSGTLQRFAKRASTTSIPEVQLRSWVNQQGRDAFEHWKRAETRRLYERLAAATEKRLFLFSAAEAIANADGGDPDLDQRWPPGDSKLMTVTQIHRTPIGALSQTLQFEHLVFFWSSSDLAAAAAGAVALGDHQAADLPPIEVFRSQTLANASHVIDRLDPAVFMIESSAVSRGLSADLAELLSSYRRLPVGAMNNVLPSDTAAKTAHVKWGHGNGHVLVSLMNLAPWPSDLELECSSPIDWVVLGGAASPRVSTRGHRTIVSLPAGEMLILRSTKPAPAARVMSWSPRVSGGAESLREITRQVTAIVDRLGILADLNTYPALSNGGFERPGKVGLVGWMHAQFPANSVQIDDSEAIEGKRSVLLTTDARAVNQTWLVSEMITPPESGRLAVSMALRGELREGDSTHRLRISIEGIRDGEPIRQSSEIEIPRNGSWQPREVVLEADGVEPSAVDSIRLTVDSLSAGRIWIDDVRLHDWFPMAKERGELQSQSFLAVQGLQRGNLAPASTLLKNYWARYLLTKEAPQEPPPVIESTQPAAGPIGVAERIRSWLPRPLRF